MEAEHPPVVCHPRRRRPEGLPRVRNATVGAYAPMGDMRGTRRFARADQPPPVTGQEPVALDLPVGADYFSVMGIEVKQGRSFTDRDGPDAPPVMIVSETFARTHFPGEDAIGRKFASSRAVRAAHLRRLAQSSASCGTSAKTACARRQSPQMYVAICAELVELRLLLRSGRRRSRRPPRSVQRVVTAVDPERPARDVLTTQAIVRGSTERHRAITLMLLALAGLAILLAMVGLYGIVATAAAARAREMAIRAAIGARPA